MNKKSLGLLSGIIVFASALSLTIASCDNNATDPGSPVSKGGRGKGPQVLNDGGVRMVETTRAGIEESNLDYNFQTTSLTVENFNNGGISTVPSEGGIVWSQSIRAVWPDNGGIELLSIAEDLGETSSLTLQQEADVLVTIPTFTGGSDVYHIDLYDNGNLVGTVHELPVGQQLIIYPVNPGNPCCRAMNSNGFIVDPTYGACIWTVQWDPCCYWRYTAPDGTEYVFNGINYVEGVEDEHYPYHHFNEIQVRPVGGGVELFAVTSEYVLAE